MNPTPHLSELKFSYRAFLAYLNDLLISKHHGRTIVETDPIDQEINKTEVRLNDLDILIKRQSHEG